MDGQIDVFTLLTLVVAVVAVFKLRSVLGRRTGDEDSRIEQRARDMSAQRNDQAPGQDKVVNLPRRDRDKAPMVPPAADEVAINLAEERIKAIGRDTGLTQSLLAVLKSDPGFHPDQFVNGSKQAYEMIVSAFAEGNRKMLRDLLGPAVNDGFGAAISEREKRGEKLEQTFVGISKADIIHAEMDKGAAQITVRFVSELITATRDRAGELIDGDATKPKVVTDLWTFSRDVSSARARSNPNWKLIATEPLN